MKRVGNLYAQIADIDNIRLAYIKSRRGKEGKPNVYEFSENLSENLLNIREALIRCNVEVGNYHYFTIHDPKERIICAASFPC